MNKSKLAAHVVSETSVTRAAADRVVGAVFSAIADALTRHETVAITGFGKFTVRRRAARRGRNPRTGEPVEIAASRVPSFKPANALRDAVNEWRRGTAPVPALRPAGLAGAERTAVESRSPRPGTLVAERRRREICDSSPARTHAQSRAEIESPRARDRYTTRGEFSTATAVRSDALQSKRKRSLAAYDGPPEPDSNPPVRR